MPPTFQIKMAQNSKPGEGDASGLQGCRASPRPAFDGCGSDLTAAAPRHLFDRGSGSADPRSEERHQRRCAHPASKLVAGSVRVSAPSPPGCSKAHADVRADHRLRRRHRRQPADLAQACRRAMGSSGWRDASRRWCSTDYATGSPSSATVACAHARRDGRDAAGRRGTASPPAR